MCHDQFDVHPRDDIDHMAMEESDQDYSHEEYQARTCLQQSWAFVVRSEYLNVERQEVWFEEREQRALILTVEITQSSAIICELTCCVCLIEITKEHIHRWKIKQCMMKVEDDCIFVAEEIIRRDLFVVDEMASKDKTFCKIEELSVAFLVLHNVSKLFICVENAFSECE